MTTELHGHLDAADARLEELSEVVNLYFIEGLDQRQIADRVGVSRSTVSRMITEARALGLVEIRVNRPLPQHEGLQSRARERYPHAEVLVIDADRIKGDPLTRVAALAARHVSENIQDRSIVATSWGTTLAATAAALPVGTRWDVTVVQMVGAAGAVNPEVDGSELARTMARRLNGRFVQLNAPLVVDEPEVAQALLRQRAVGTVLDEAAQADLALIGLGTVDPETSSLHRAGFVSSDVLAQARANGVVGDVAGHLVTADGQIANFELNARLIRLAESKLRAIRHVVAVATGRHKAPIVAAALDSGLIDLLVTDSHTMKAVMDQEVTV